MIALRHFKALCAFGVFLGGLSFLMDILAIVTNHWFEAVETVLQVDQTGDENSIMTSTTVSSATILKWTRATRSGLWHVCFKNVTPYPSDWQCVKSLTLLEHLETTQLTAFQSLVAFELISSIATLTGCLVALIAMILQQPLAVLVAGFTMFFSGMFMLVGHLMMFRQHIQQMEDDIDWQNGYSYKLAWTSFALCLITGVIDFIVYRNLRKITEEMMVGTVPGTNAKYVTRSSPVNLSSSI